METNNVILIRINRNHSCNKLNKVRRREQIEIFSGSSLEDQLQGVHPFLQSFKFTFTKSPPRFTGLRRNQLQYSTATKLLHLRQPLKINLRAKPLLVKMHKNSLF